MVYHFMFLYNGHADYAGYSFSTGIGILKLLQGRKTLFS